VATSWFIYQHHQISRELAVLNADLSLMETRTKADELFMAGDHDAAFSLYRQIDSLTTDSLEKKRVKQRFFQQTSSEADQLATLSQKLERTTALLGQYQARESADENNDGDHKTNYREQELEAEARSLKEKLLAAQKEIEAVRNSQGIIRFSSTKNGSVTYFGKLRNGKADGTGFGYWTSGSSYDGQWRDNLRHGKGQFLWVDGEKYEGEYKYDQRNGYGVYTAKAGKYEGQWLNDMRHGEGKLYEPNGKLKVHGVWEKDKLVTTIK
jgi:hypothetical protein